MDIPGLTNMITLSPVVWVTGSHSLWARLPMLGIPVLTLTDVMAVFGSWSRNSVCFPTGKSNKWLCIFSCVINTKAKSKENLSTLPQEATGSRTLPVCTEHGDGRPHLPVVPATHRLVLMSTQGRWAWEPSRLTVSHSSLVCSLTQCAFRVALQPH